MRTIGIMQGRLTPPKGRGVQFFPAKEWGGEFVEAKKLGLSDIDFIFPYEEFEKNPLWTEAGIEKIKIVISESGVGVKDVCGMFFMPQLLSENDERVRKENVAVLKKLTLQAQKIGAKSITLPLLDTASLKNEQAEKMLTQSLNEILPDAKVAGITILLETDLPPQRFLSLLEQFPHENVAAVYDIGNSSSFGYNPEEEISVLGKHIALVHTKDRVRGGGNVPLGEGDANFDAVFKALKKIQYQGNFMIEAARGEEGKEVETVSAQRSFTSRYIEKYVLK